LLVIPLPVSWELKLTKPIVLVLAVIQKLKVDSGPGSALHYKNLVAGIGPLDVVDLAIVQCGIGWVLDCDHWVITPYNQYILVDKFHIFCI